MAALANIVINDGQATPVAHTFIPVGQDKNGVWMFEDKAINTVYNPNGIPSLYPRLSLGLTRAPYKSNTAKNRVKLVLTRPRIGYDPNGNATGTAGDEPDLIIELRSNNLSTDADRNDLIKLLGNALNNTIILDAMKSLVAPT